MNFKIFTQNIGFTTDTISAMIGGKVNIDCAYELFKEEFYADSEKFIIQYRDTFSSSQWLYFYCRLAIDLYDLYRDKHIEDEIYFDTFSDLRIWNEQCLFETGKNGILEWDWLSNHLKLRLFKLGRLQFEARITDEKYRIHGQTIESGASVLYCHIPKGESLTYEAVNKSYFLASQFYGEDRMILCESWLLSPALNNFLKASSNIIKFASDYEIIHVNPQSDSGERYIFGVMKKNKRDYIATSAFAENIKEFLLKKNHIGEATGGFWLKDYLKKRSKSN